MYRWPCTVCGCCVPSACSELRTHCLDDVASCRVDVRCHPDDCGLIEAFCSAYCGEITV